MEKLNDKVGDLRIILEDILVELEQRDEKVDLEVTKQHTRMYKFYCYVMYGHLFDKKGICKRCGKEVKQ